MHDLLSGDPLRDPRIVKLALQGVGRARASASQALADADARVDRAADHIADLKGAIGDYAAGQEGAVQVTQFPDGSVCLRHGEGPPPPGSLAIRIGEAVYNMRAGLDYLVYGLAWLDSGRHFDMTQFPIDEGPAAFERHRRSWLGGVGDEHVERIRGLQPAFGCTWTRSLRDASNRDKHWSPNVAQAQGSAQAVNIGQPDFKVSLDIRIVSDAGEEVVDWLEGLRLRTMAVLEDFRPDFDRDLIGEVGGQRYHLRRGPPRQRA